MQTSLSSAEMIRSFFRINYLILLSIGLTYLPVFSLAAPVPLVLLFVRAYPSSLLLFSGVVWGVVMGFFAPDMLVSFLILSFSIALILFVQYRKGFSMSGLTRSIVIYVLVLLLLTSLTGVLTGVNPVNYLADMIDKNITQIIQTMQERDMMKMGDEWMQKMEGNRIQMVQAVRFYTFAFLSVSLFSAAFVSLYFSRAMLLAKHRKEKLRLTQKAMNKLKKIKSLGDLRIKFVMVWPFIAAWAGVAAGVLLKNQAVRVVCMNAAVILSFFFFLQGAAVLYALGKRIRLSFFLKSMMLFIMISLGLLPVLIILTTGFGLFDQWIDFRTPRNNGGKK